MLEKILDTLEKAKGYYVHDELTPRMKEIINKSSMLGHWEGLDHAQQIVRTVFKELNK